MYSPLLPRGAFEIQTGSQNFAKRYFFGHLFSSFFKTPDFQKYFILPMKTMNFQERWLQKAPGKVGGGPLF